VHKLLFAIIPLSSTAWHQDYQDDGANSVPGGRQGWYRRYIRYDRNARRVDGAVKKAALWVKVKLQFPTALAYNLCSTGDSPKDGLPGIDNQRTGRRPA
jgi:hypothetical protein